MKRASSADEQTIRRGAMRIGLQTVAAVGLTVVLLTAVGVLVVLTSQRSAETDMINAALDRADDVDDPPAGMWLVIQRAGQLSASPGLPQGFPDQEELRLVTTERSARTVDVEADGTEYRVSTRLYGPDGVIQGVVDLTADHEQRTRLVGAFLATGLAGLVLAGVIGLWLARRAMAPMAAALALQRRFVADAGHELRTPLTLLSTRAQLLRRSLPDSARSDVDSLVRDTHRLAGILDDLLLTADRSLPRERVEVGELVWDIVDSAQASADEQNVSITVDDTGSFAMSGAPMSLRRALNALLDNAVRHAAGQVRVTVGRDGRSGFVDVTDDGPGLDPEIRSTLFTRFATTPADGARGGPRRYGLGLALVSEIAAQHGGSIEVNEDQGTTFRLRLPADFEGRQR